MLIESNLSGGNKNCPPLQPPPLARTTSMNISLHHRVYDEESVELSCRTALSIPTLKVESVVPQTKETLYRRPILHFKQNASLISETITERGCKSCALLRCALCDPHDMVVALGDGTTLPTPLDICSSCFLFGDTP